MITFRHEATLLLSVVTSSVSVTGITGCAQAWRPNTEPTVLEERRVFSTRQILRAPEIAKSNATTAYDVIARLRPEFLSSSAARKTDGSLFPPVVYINDAIAGDVALLRGISPDMIAEIRYVPPRDATTYHGASHRGGEIMVYTYHPRSAQPPF